MPGDTSAAAESDSIRIRIGSALDVPVEALDDRTTRFVEQSWELALFEALDEGEVGSDQVRDAAEHAFQLLRVLSTPSDPLAREKFLVRLGCLGVLADRQADAARLLKDYAAPVNVVATASWGERAQFTIWDAWVRLVRKAGWEDLDGVERSVRDLRNAQQEFESDYLDTEAPNVRARAWELVGLYHMAHAAEILAEFTVSGAFQGRFDIREQLASQFDRVDRACSRGELIELSGLLVLVRATAARLIDNSIWTVTRAVNSRVTEFVRSVVDRGNRRPLFEVLPPQRHALRERGLLGSAARSVVVSLPTSSGKTLVAQFRILQALNQFDREQGWVAYLAPTRALVNQIARRLREDFAPLGVPVERVSPALEVDGLEANLLTEEDEQARFRVLVTTPEKLDLLIRGGWEAEIGRPLTLVVVDEAHNLQQGPRGLRLELLLATINRECRYAQFLLLTPS